MAWVLGRRVWRPSPLNDWPPIKPWEGLNVKFATYLKPWICVTHVIRFEFRVPDAYELFRFQMKLHIIAENNADGWIFHMFRNNNSIRLSSEAYTGWTIFAFATLLLPWQNISFLLGEAPPELHYMTSACHCREGNAFRRNCCQTQHTQ